MSILKSSNRRRCPIWHTVGCLCSAHASPLVICFDDCKCSNPNTWYILMVPVSSVSDLMVLINDIPSVFVVLLHPSFSMHVRRLLSECLNRMRGAVWLSTEFKWGMAMSSHSRADGLGLEGLPFIMCSLLTPELPTVSYLHLADTRETLRLPVSECGAISAPPRDTMTHHG